jgi:hypothetical protein
MTVPLGVLVTGSVAAITEVEDVDGGAPGGPGVPTINAKKRRRWALGRCRG